MQLGYASMMMVDIIINRHIINKEALQLVEIDLLNIIMLWYLGDSWRYFSGRNDIDELIHMNFVWLPYQITICQ